MIFSRQQNKLTYWKTHKSERKKNETKVKETQIAF